MAQITSRRGVRPAARADSGCMSTYTLEQLGPVLVSDLPPVGPIRPGLLGRLRAALAHRLEEYSFERALRAAGPGEHSDLIAAHRRS